MRDLPFRTLLAGAFLLLVALMTSSCTTMSKKECLAGDWRSVGYSDGASGYRMGVLDLHAKACARVGVVPEIAPYQEGREEGLKTYCTLQRGFSVGRYGRIYGGVCPHPAEAEFLVGYADGQRVHAATQRLDSAKSDLSLADQRADKRARQADGVEEELRNPKLTEEQTRELRDRLSRLRRERREAIEDGRRAEVAIREAEREVDDLKSYFAPRYGWW